jgi:2,4-diaminopentanoate dehydrogenase
MRPSRGVVSVVHYGLGPIGRSIATLVAQHTGLASRAAIDVASDIRGTPLPQLIGAAPWPAAPVVVGSLAEADTDGAVIAVHSTGSSLALVLPQILELVDRRLHVLSTCEELSYPDRYDESVRALDEHARARGVAVLGTGVNPGFAMDFLPIVVSAVAPSVESVSVRRVQNASQRRIPLQRKIGAGLSPEEFRVRAERGSLGHVGLRQSASALAAAFGWTLTSYVERIDPVIAHANTSSGVGEIAAGRVLGIHQTARGSMDDRIVVDLDLTMAVGAADAHDLISLHGAAPIEVRIPGGLHGDVATAAIVVNTIPRLIEAAPGLRTMADISAPHAWRSSARAYATA